MNIIDISYSSSEFRRKAPLLSVRCFLRKILRELDLNNVEFSVSFVSEDEIHEMNRAYREIDDSTDILSFASLDQVEGCNFVVGPRKTRNIGDMVICLPVCFRNAKTFNVTEAQELHRLLIHGVLHLSGENHLTNEVSQEPMLQKQEELLKKLYSQK